MAGPMDDAYPRLVASDVLPLGKTGGHLLGPSDPQWRSDTMKFAADYADLHWPGQDVAINIVALGQVVRFTLPAQTINVAASRVRGID